MAKAQLDSLDYKILKTLSTNGRKPFLEIARECGVSERLFISVYRN